ncbi:MAG: MFS transporter [Candidatus Latescibacteria bacterium]|nr:MFS transporter [Candidatus Latescibacterota bacterium]NIO57356.1 MFS transporter [Candidatus Latescibacterota bacterium]
MFGILKPKETVSEAEVGHGLQMLLHDGVCSQIMGVVTGGAFLVAFALLLGASNVVIGLLAAIGPLTQILQIPAILLVDRIALRKALVVISSFFSRVAWLAVAALPWIVGETLRLPILVICLFFYFSLGTISSCAFNSWMRDFVPQDIMGSYFGKRMAVSIAVGAVLTLLAGVGIEAGKTIFPAQYPLYSILFLIGAASGLTGVAFLARIPEPRMPPQTSKGIITVLGEPFRNKNFRALLIFLGTWNFAINLAAPFFVVYMIKRLEMSMALVLALSVLSQMANVMFLRLWGRLGDRYSNKSVLAVSGPLFIVSIIMWPFLTLPEKHVLTLPLLVIIHILAGMSTAGVTLCTGNIALKTAPKGKATSYLASNALVNGIAATLAPIIAGVAADRFSGEQLTLAFRWIVTETGVTRFEVPALALSGLDFLFVIAFLLGLYAIYRLPSVREEGEVEEKIVVTELYSEVRKAFRHVSNVAGLRHLTYFPYEKIKEMIQKR